MRMRGVNRMHLSSETMQLAMEMWLNDGVILQSERLSVFDVTFKDGWCVLHVGPPTPKQVKK